MGRRTLLLIASILVAALGTALIWLYVQGADTRAAAGEDQVQVYVAAQTVPAGQPLPSNLAQTRTLPRSVVAKLQGQLVTSPAQLRGYAKTDILAGLPLVQSQIADNQAAPAPVVDLQPNEVAMQVTLPDPQRLAGLLQSGSRIRVYAPMKAGTATGVGVLFKNVRVLTSGPAPPTTTSGQGAQVPQAIITLALTNDQAKTLVLAQTGGGGRSGSGGATALWFGLLPNAKGLGDDTTVLSRVVPGGQ
jgi:pilus assembly protein CpaB